MKRHIMNQLMAMILLVSIYALSNVVVHTSWLIKDYPVFENAIEYLEVPPHVPFGFMDFQAALEEEESYLMPKKAKSPGQSGADSDDLEWVTTSSVPHNGGGSKSANASAIKHLKILLETITKPTYHCSKLINQGGRTCQLVPDGEKKVCLDEGISPKWNSCIVYSIGIGHDFTYDYFMGKYGCNVFSLDHDYLHSFYDYSPYKRVYMANVRLGTQVEYRTIHDTVENTTFTYFYRPLDNIMYILHHERANLDVLKIDIEGDEFKVFEEHIFKTDILERTRQLSIEIHLEKFLEDNSSSEKIEEITKNYIRFFDGLKGYGFELAYYEPNIITSWPLVKVLGVNFPIYSELLWVNRRVRLGEIPVYKKPILYYVRQLEPKDKHLIQSH